MSFKTNIPTPSVQRSHSVAVILPVYRHVEMTQRAILSAIPGILSVIDSQLLIINDSSPDEGMQAMLEDYEKQWPKVITVLQNDINLGFVKTVNRGINYRPNDDIILLNSDVIVATDWLKRLIDEAYQADKIATVTPFSNNATICSFPQFLQKNSLCFNLKTEAINHFFQQSYLPCIEAPTGVGFCMYIRRTCLDEIGLLNVEKFGRGYGEENDLCQRAIKNDWKNLISPNIYAYHEGEVSFADDKQALVDHAMKVIEKLHPNYHGDVQKFIKVDPLKSARITRYIQLICRLDLPKVLHISHGLGGGIAQHIDELGNYFGQTMVQLVLEAQNKTGEVTLHLAINHHSDSLFFNLEEDYTSVIKILKTIGISCIHFHHTLRHSSKIFQLPLDLKVAHIVSIHDFYWLAGNPTLTDEDGIYPGEYSETLSNPLYPLPDGLSLGEFRRPLSELLKTAKQIIFPSQSTKQIFGHIYPLDKAVVVAHLETNRPEKEPNPIKKKDRYTIGTLGAISKEKGADLLEKLSNMAQNTQMPFQFILLGYAYKNLATVDTTGPYEPIELTQLIAQHHVDIIFFPAQWPETYSYTLSYALNSGLPIIAPNLGAFPERLSNRAHVLLFSPHLTSNQLNDKIKTFITHLENNQSVPARTFQGTKAKQNFYQQSYCELVSSDSKQQSSATFVLKENWLTQTHTTKQLTWKESTLAYLWKLYMKDSTQWVVRLIPFESRRLIKRLLSHRPLHEIINVSGKE